MKHNTCLKNNTPFIHPPVKLLAKVYTDIAAKLKRSGRTCNYIFNLDTYPTS